MPIFTTQLGRIEAGAPAALQRLAAHIRYLRETLEYTLMNLDSDGQLVITGNAAVSVDGGEW